MNTPDLNDCPFCGGGAWLDRRAAIVHCNDCHVQKEAPIPYASDDTEAAVRAWNTRAVQKQRSSNLGAWFPVGIMWAAAYMDWMGEDDVSIALFLSSCLYLLVTSKWTPAK